MYKRAKIALIADLATIVGLNPDAEIIHITPKNWWFKINVYKPDYLLVESAWRGYKNTWQGRIVDKQDQTLINIVNYCKMVNIPTIFWNKEDPLYFERFKQTAVLFDYIFTTDSASIYKYWKIKENKFLSVDTLMFCAQPKLHFPPMRTVREDAVVFLGGYYGEELSKRSKQQQNILTAFNQHNLKIYDRFWLENKASSSFPLPLQPYCLPAVSVFKVNELYRKYSLYINFNSIQDSPTMLSRRVFELAASRAAIISTPSLAMRDIFKQTIPEISDDDHLINQYELKESVTQKNIDIAYEIVMDSHTWRHRLNQIHEKIGLY